MHGRLNIKYEHIKYEQNLQEVHLFYRNCQIFCAHIIILQESVLYRKVSHSKLS